MARARPKLNSCLLKIGNSRMVLWDGARKRFSWPSDPKKIAEVLETVSKRPLFFVSVVPRLNRKLIAQARRRGVRAIEACLPDLSIRPAYKKNIGFDRLLNGEGALFLFDKNIVVMDVGTGLTVDFFTKDRKHLGGWIAAGPHLALRALSQFTAKLPEIRPRKLQATLGRSTEESLLIGQREILHGMILSIRVLARKIFRGRFELVLTGGGSDLLPRGKEKRVRDLSLWGLYSLLNKGKNGETSISRSKRRFAKNL